MNNNSIKRERWESRTAFIFAGIGSAIGLGNIWRFPYIAYENGGGAFLIPYIIALLTTGIPLMILEFGLGHMINKGAPLSFAKIRKGSEWIGWCALIFGFVIVCYYVVIMAWCLNYLVYSFSLSWGEDPKSFFFEKFLNISKGPAEIGQIRIPILISLIVCWAMIYFIIYKGIKFIGKVVIWTAGLPFILIIILIIKGLSLPGALEGINFYLTPDFSKLMQPRVWLAAYGQIFFSLSLAFGILIAYASYLPKKADITNNACIISLSDSGFSFLAGFVVFSTLGYFGFMENKPVTEVVEVGKSIGLSFITYPTVISKLSFAPILGFLFFLLLLTLAIDSAFSLVEAGVTGIADKWQLGRKTSTIIICSLGFLLGIIFTTRGGLYWLDIIDYFICHFGLPLIAVAECIVIGYLFNTKEFKEYINSFSEFKIGKLWSTCIKVVTPTILGVMFILELIRVIRGGYESYPNWALCIGVLILIISIVVSIFFMKAKTHE